MAVTKITYHTKTVCFCVEYVVFDTEMCKLTILPLGKVSKQQYCLNTNCVPIYVKTQDLERRGGKSIKMHIKKNTYKYYLRVGVKTCLPEGPNSQGWCLRRLQRKISDYQPRTFQVDFSFWFSDSQPHYAFLLCCAVAPQHVAAKHFLYRGITKRTCKHQQAPAPEKIGEGIQNSG